MNKDFSITIQQKAGHDSHYAWHSVMFNRSQIKDHLAVLMINGSYSVLFQNVDFKVIFSLLFFEHGYLA